jgi:hypothetical protein
MKMAKPSGLIVKCPHCGGDNEVLVTDLQENDFPCQYSHCEKQFATCGNDDFMRYLGYDD